jgi:DNA-directed RNA polymerase specialized sigma24 family protein
MVTFWLGDLKAGGDAAAQHLWERFSEQLIDLAWKKLRSKRGTMEGGEDIALKVFDTFCRRAKNGQFPQLNDRNDLWRLLVVITKHKAWKQIRDETTQKEGGGKLLTGGVPIGAGDDGSGGGLDQIGCVRVIRGGVAVEVEATPGFAALVVEEFLERLDALGDERLREVVVMRMEGYTDDQIAERLGVTRRSVQRRLKLVREEWMKENGPECPSSGVYQG